MTTPIVFTPTPKDAFTDNADAQDAFTQVATTTFANFQKINPWFTEQTPTFARNTLVSRPAAWTADGVWHDFLPADWPPLNITIPKRCAGLVVCHGAAVDVRRGWGAWLSLRVRLSGATTYVMHPDFYYGNATLVNDVGITTSRLIIVPANELTPPGVVTITVQYQWINSTDGSNTDLYFGNGTLFAIGLL